MINYFAPAALLCVLVNLKLPENIEHIWPKNQLPAVLPKYMFVGFLDRANLLHLNS